MNDSKRGNEWGREAEAAELRAGLERVIERARVEAKAGAPAGMVSMYVEMEARHALDGHGRAINGVSCSDCLTRVSRDRAAGVTP